MNVLIVDDDPANIKLLVRVLAEMPEIRPTGMPDPVAALEWCRHHTPDLVLVDYMMPEMDGLHFLHEFRLLPERTSIPVIMATAETDRDVRYRALQMGANDFLTKPFDKIELLARVRNMLVLRKCQLQLSDRAAWLDDEVRRATHEIAAREREAIHKLSRAAEYRDPETGAHLRRLSNYAQIIGGHLGMSAAECDLLGDAAPMHDIGKVGIPDHILLKPGRLDERELAIMRTHPLIGARILEGSEAPLLQAAHAIALSHHEKFDGSGYPHGLKGEQIPLYGRIVAVADVFDALTSPRPYKSAWEFDRAIAWLREGAGSHFDPACVDAFLRDTDAVLHIHQCNQDEDGE